MRRDAYEDKILANVAEFGCHVTTVFDPEGAQPTFTYSTGFVEMFDCGEVIIFGLDNGLMQRMVNYVRDQLQERRIQLRDGVVISDLLAGHDCIARRVDASNLIREYFNTAMWYSRYRLSRDLTEAFQIVWPSVGTKLYPWDANCPEDVIALQPPLYLGAGA